MAATVERDLVCDRIQYANMPMQYAAIFKGRKNDNFLDDNFFKMNGTVLIFAENIDCGYTLEPPHSNDHP